MVEATNTTNQAAPEDICQDKEISAIRQKTFSKMKWAPMYNSLSRLLCAIGGPILGAGMLALVAGGGAMIAAPTAITLAIVGAVLTVAGIAVDYMGSRSSQDGYLDQTEVGARSNARYLVKELKAQNMCMTPEHTQNCRADGQKWAQVVRQSDQPPMLQTQQG